MLGSIEGWASDFCHSGIHFYEVVSIRSSIDYIDNLCNERSTIGCDKSPWFHFEMELSSCFFCEIPEKSLHMIPDLFEIRSLLIVHTCHLESSTQRDNLDIREPFRDSEDETCHLFPYFWVRSRSDMGMELGDGEVILLCYMLCFLEVFVPDTKARCWSSDIGTIGSSRSHTRIDTNRSLCSRENFTISLKLMQTCRIEFNSELYDLFEILWHFLSCELYMIRRNASSYSTYDLVTTRCIYMETLTREYAQDIHIRACLHGVASRESKVMREIHDFSSLFSENLF